LLFACAPKNHSENWINLSEGFDSWNQVGDGNWRVEGSEFVADAGVGHLVTKQSFANFQIQLEFWTDAGANSGIFIRASDPENITDKNSYEVNIFDTRPDQTYRTGGVVNFAAPSEVINTPNQWNTYDITADGNKFTVILNGVTTAEFTDDTFSSGPFTLQCSGGTLKFKNVRAREL
jgi:hypothetical protein